jgi:hypothetical protein
VPRDGVLRRNAMKRLRPRALPRRAGARRAALMSPGQSGVGAGTAEWTTAVRKERSLPAGHANGS